MGRSLDEDESQSVLEPKSKPEVESVDEDDSLESGTQSETNLQSTSLSASNYKLLFYMIPLFVQSQSNNFFTLHRFLCPITETASLITTF